MMIYYYVNAKRRSFIIISYGRRSYTSITAKIHRLGLTNSLAYLTVNFTLCISTHLYLLIS